MIKEKLNYDMYLHWELIRECNFNCTYCFSNPRLGKVPDIDIKKAIDRLDKFKKTFLITLTGGEPFLIPNFTEFVHELSKKHFVRIDTNLSVGHAFDKFINTISPERVIEITWSIHIAEREILKLKISRLTDAVKKFEAKGFKMSGNYVVYPPVMSRIEADMAHFASEGLTVSPSLFVGRYEGREYPIYKDRNAYKQEELKIINKYNRQAHTVLQKTKNVLCQAGSAAFYVNADDDVFPCVTVDKKIGNFYEDWDLFPKVIRCPKDYCYCPFNRSFTSSSKTGMQEALLAETVKKKGEASVMESFFRMTSPVRMAKIAASPIVDAMKLRGTYYAVKKKIVAPPSIKQRKQAEAKKAKKLDESIKRKN